MRRLAGICLVAAPAAALVVAPQAPTFDDIAPIVFRSCSPCHSPGGPAPFNLRNYREFRRRAERIGINVASMAMPPCQIRSDFGQFSQIPGLSTNEVVLVRRWATGGALPGTKSAEFGGNPTFSWRLGKPDVIVKSTKLTAPAEGGIHWVFAKVRLKQGGKFRGLQLRPRDSRVIRQAVVGWAMPGIPTPAAVTAFPSGVTPIAAWAFGYCAWRAPHGTGLEVPDGAEIHVMLQCQATGRPRDASFELGLYRDYPQGHAAKWLILEKTDFTIGIGDKPTYTVEQTLARQVRVISLLPEFRYACERVDLTAILPDGQAKLLFGGRWDVYWTGAYNFVVAPTLPAGTMLRLTASYNNGFEATHGPDVRQPIKHGVGLKDELCRMSLLID